MKKIFTLTLSALLVFSIFAGASNKSNAANPEIGVVERLGAQVPLNLEFTNSDGRKMKLKDIIDRPTILSLVYYHCPGICSPLLTNETAMLDKLEMEVGKEFRVLTISFDHTETYDKAVKWKSNYLTSMKRQFDPQYWNFMVGDSASIRAVADSVGFYFKSDGANDYIHAAAIMILTKDGKVSRYHNGTDFNKVDVKMSLIEAGKGESMPTVNKIVQYCFKYDPEGKKYVFDFNKVAGSIIFLSVGIFLAVLLIKGRKNKDASKNKDKGGDNV